MIGFPIAFGLVLLLTPAVIRLARARGWVAQPSADRWHQRPTALMGGIALYLASSIAWWLILPPAEVFWVWLPATLLFGVGLVDDRRPLRPYVKLIAQIMGCAVFLIPGERFGALPYALAGPVTLLWLVGITNAINLLDNMDGLAAGVTGIASLTLAINAALQDDLASATAALCLAGACIGFLAFNFRPASIFMGDSGSLFLGFCLGALSVSSVPRSAPNLLAALTVPVMLLAIPIFDTALVTFARVLHGRRISQGGRDHSSHRLFALGLSESWSVLFLYVLTAASGLLAVTVTELPLSTALLLVVAFVVALVALGLFIGFIRVYPASDPHVTRLVQRSSPAFQFAPQFVQVILDTLLVPIAFGGAHLLRFEGRIPVEIKSAVLAALPLVWVARLGGLALVRAYRGEWRFAGLMDGVNGVAGATLGSLLMALVLGSMYGFKDFSRAALLLDWLLYSVLAAAARVWYPILSELFGLIPPRHGRKVVLVGIGWETPARVQLLRNPFAPYQSQILGYVDDRPERFGKSLNGVKVLGPVEDLRDVLDAEPSIQCVLGVSAFSERGHRLLEACARLGVTPLPDVENLHEEPAEGEA